MGFKTNGNGSGAATMTMGAKKPAVKVSSSEPMRSPKSARQEQDCCCGSGACSTPTTEQVAAKAYSLWETRGGDALENWLEAERMLKNGTNGS